MSKGGVPYWALGLMLIPSIPISALYAYSPKFASYTLDATLVIAITFLGTTVSAVKLRAHRTYQALREALGPMFERSSP